MNATAKASLFAFVYVLMGTTYATVIHLESREGSAAVCKGTVVVTQCTTTTNGGFLLWRNSSGSSFSFDDAASVNDTGTLRSMTMILDRKDPVGNAFVYTSTASDIIMEETNFTCSDGTQPERIDISANSPSSPSWAYSPCRFSQGSVKLSWNPPVVAPQCCQYYTVKLSTDESIPSNILSINVSAIGTQPVTATVHCIDHLGDNTTSQVMAIDNSTALRVTIEVLNSSCDANTYYNISWTTNQGVCTPPITMSTITCTTSSTHQSSYNTRSMICSVPANETINATVTVTNEAGVTTTKSTSADALAQTCQSCIAPSPSPTGEPSPSSTGEPSPEPTSNQIPPSAVAAIVISVLLAVCIACIATMVVYIVLTCFEVIPQPKETYEQIKTKCSRGAKMDLP